MTLQQGGYNYRLVRPAGEDGYSATITNASVQLVGEIVIQVCECVMCLFVSSCPRIPSIVWVTLFNPGVHCFQCFASLCA